MSLGIFDVKNNLCIRIEGVNVRPAEILLDGEPHPVSDGLEVFPSYKSWSPSIRVGLSKSNITLIIRTIQGSKFLTSIIFLI